MRVANAHAHDDVVGTVAGETHALSGSGLVTGDDVLIGPARVGSVDSISLTPDAPQWKTIKLAKRDSKSEHQTGCTQLDYYDFVSAGPDGEFDRLQR